jgi:tight adherence protein C
MFSNALTNAAPALAGLLAACAVAFLALALRTWSGQVQLSERMDRFVTPMLASVTMPAGFEDLSFGTRAVGPVVEWMSRIARNLLPDRQIERLRTNLGVAGLPYARHLAQFLAAQMAIGGGVGTLLGLYALRARGSLLLAVLSGVVAGVLGYYLPVLWLGRRMASRRQQVLRALPDALDLLSISVSAGLGFDGALMEVIQRWDNPLTFELAAVLRDMKLGTSRHDALRALATRTGVDEVTSFVAAVLQADELGAPMKDVLLIQSQQMRMNRRYRAEERARKATVKMLIPMVFFIFPAMFIVLLGPAVPSLKMLSTL